MNERLQAELRRAGARFEVITHPEAYTAQERAAALNLAALQALTGRPELKLATEKEFAPLFPDCELGAMPPFGHLYGMSAFLDTSLADEPEFVFEGGTHREEIRMPMGEYLRLEGPAIAAVASMTRAA